MTTHRLLLAASILGSVCLVGCSGGSSNTPSSISGKITYNETPVTAGTVIFFTDQGVYPLPIGANGEYAGSDLPAGAAKISIETESANPEKKKSVYAGSKDKKMMSPVPEGAGGGASGQYVKIPAKYADKDKSGLTVTLTKGKQTQDFKLTD
jgi:hypothetical protein